MYNGLWPTLWLTKACVTSNLRTWTPPLEDVGLSRLLASLVRKEHISERSLTNDLLYIIRWVHHGAWKECKLPLQHESWCKHSKKFKFCDKDERILYNNDFMTANRISSNLYPRFMVYNVRLLYITTYSGDWFSCVFDRRTLAQCVPP